MSRSSTKDNGWTDLVAVHEAGHAIAAVRMRIPFDYVSIRPVPDSPGRVMIHRPEFPQPQRNGNDRTKDVVQRYFVVLFSGASAADYILKLDGAFYDAQIAEDLKDIQETAREAMHFCKMIDDTSFVKNCKTKAEKMIRIPFVSEAILDLARVLLVDEEISANAVKRIYKDTYRFSTIMKGGAV